jgi:hypothetical protein
MDITLLPDNAIRIKGKSASLVLNPTKSIGKTEAEGVLNLDSSPNFSSEKTEGSRITISGPGEFEVGGVKVSTTKVIDKFVAQVDVDNVRIVAGSGASIEKISDKFEGGGIALINADAEFDYSALSKIEPSVLIVYGDLKDEVSKKLGKDSSTKVSKFSSSADKLPQEMQFVLLG